MTVKIAFTPPTSGVMDVGRLAPGTTVTPELIDAMLRDLLAGAPPRTWLDWGDRISLDGDKLRIERIPLTDALAKK